MTAHVLASARFSIVDRAVAAIARLSIVMKNRRDFRILAEMDDRELADIGLTRADLDAMSALPLTNDPTVFLGAAAHKRAA